MQLLLLSLLWAAAGCLYQASPQELCNAACAQSYSYPVLARVQDDRCICFTPSYNLPPSLIKPKPPAVG